MEATTLALVFGVLPLTYGAMRRFALQKCSNLAQMLLANLLIARVIHWHGLLTTKYKLK